MMRRIDPGEMPICDTATTAYAETLAGVDPALLSLYWPLASHPPGETLVVAQVGQSLDGRVATSSGDAREVSGRNGLKHLHRLRALADAVIVGAGTVLHDDPRLTVREVKGQNPARVVLDPSGRVPASARIFNENGSRRIVVQTDGPDRPSGVEVIRLARRDGVIDPLEVIAALAERGLHHLLIEGGARTIGPFLLAGAINRLQITVSPLIIGDGPTGLSLPPVPTLRDCMRPRTTFHDLGGEVVIDCAFRHHAPDEGGKAKRS